MLVLSRKETQRIRVGDSIVVTVVRVSGDKVRLGIEAPADMLVLRDELEPRGEGVEAVGVGPAQLTVELNLSEVEEAILRQQVA
jgi:carbon storage regulator